MVCFVFLFISLEITFILDNSIPHNLCLMPMFSLCSETLKVARQKAQQKVKGRKQGWWMGVWHGTLSLCPVKNLQ